MILFGTLLLRIDVAFLFIFGCVFAKYKNLISKNMLVDSLFILISLFGLLDLPYLKYPIAILIFISTIDLQFKFFHTGRYSYLLHLYHSPIIVITYPLLQRYIYQPIVLIVAQVCTSLIGVWIMYKITCHFKFLKVISGGR